MLFFLFSFPMFAASYSVSYALPSSYAKAQSYRTGKPEAVANEIIGDSHLDSLRRNSANSYIPAVAQRIASYTNNDFLRVKIAHDVTALLLSYDDVNFWRGTVPQQDLSYVLRSKKSVCEGYANVFKALCDSIGIPCEKVHGYARGVSTSSGAENPTQSNHAWNIVKIGGAWYLVDCTWDSGYMSGRTNVQEYKTDWLFACPEAFICTHYPTKDAAQQLMERQVTANGFLSLPSLRPNLFDFVELSSYPRKENLVDGRCLIVYKPNGERLLSFQVQDVSTGETLWNCVFSEKIAGEIWVLIALPKSGTYKINLFADESRESKGVFCGEFTLTTSVSCPIAALSATEKRFLMNNSETTKFPHALVSKSDTIRVKKSSSSAANDAYNFDTSYWNEGNYNNYGMCGVSLTVPISALVKNEISTDKMGFALDFAGVNGKGSFITSFEYLRNLESENNLHAGIWSLAFGRRPFRNLAFYIGGGLGLRLDPSNESGAPREELKKESYCLDTGWLALKAEFGLLINISALFTKWELSYNNVFGFSTSAGIGIGF